MKIIKCVALIMAICLMLSACGNSSLSTKEGQGDTGKRASEDKKTNKPSETDPYVGERYNFQNLRIGEVGKRGNTYVGLQYVKVMPRLPDGFGKKDFPIDHEVIVGFFEFFNCNTKTTEYDYFDITCYADGIQVNHATPYRGTIDEVMQYYDFDLDPGYTALNFADFEVKKGWKEIKFFYGSECSWTIENTEVSEKPYERTSLFTVSQTAEPTALDTVIYAENYDIQYKGCCFKDDYLIFKFHITNKMSTELDMAYMGFKMRAYQDMVFIGDATSTRGTVDEYTNIWNITSLAPGMSANIYLAFGKINESPYVTLSYDDGFISHHYCGTVYDIVR